MNSRNDRILHIALIAAFALPLLAHMFVGSYTRMMADDFCYASTAARLGVIGTVIDSYQTWTGRIGNIVALSVIASVRTAGASLFPPLLILMWLLFLYWTLCQFTHPIQLRSPRFAALLLAMLIVTATFAGSPQLLQSVYWLAGAVTYALPLLFFTVEVGFVLLVIRQRARWVFPLFPVLTFAAGTFSEAFVMLQTAALLFALLAARGRTRRDLLVFIGMGLVGSILALALLVAAPGNAVRQTGFEPASSLFSAGTDALIHAAAFVVVSVSSFSPGAALAAFIIPALLAYQLFPPERLSRATRRQLRVLMMSSPIIGFMLITAFMFPSIYATSLPPPARGFIVPQAILITSLVAVGMLVGIYARKVRLASVLKDAAVVLAVIAVVILPILSTVQTAALIPVLSTFAAEFDQRDAMIRAAAARGETTLTVAPLTVDVGERVGLETIGADPEFWVNGCAARYYGLEAIVAE